MTALLRAAAAQPGPASPDCLDDETIAAVVDGTMELPERSAATRHLASCARCRGAVASVVRGLADITVAREISAIDGVRTRRFARFTRFSRILVPAAAAAALVVILVRPRGSDNDSSRHRAPTITSAVAPVPRFPIAAVAEARVLRWSSVPGADRYRVTLLDAGGRVVYETQLADTAAALPDSVKLVPGRSYLWSVEARIGWDRWSSSPLTEFSMVAAPRR
jgi:hypothetical protein